jgi:hypothetical protein
LNQKVYKKLELHQLITDIVTVTVGLDNKEIKTFGSWNEFKNTDWSISATTKYLLLEWEFNLILPNQTHKVPQTHTLRVRIGNNLKPSEMIQVIFQGGAEEDIEEAQSQMSCKIDFINSQICNELKTVICDWYDTLPKNSEDHKLIQFISKHEIKLQYFIIFSFLTACIILVNYLFSNILNSELSFLPKTKEEKIFLLSTSSLALFYIFYQSGRLFADRMMRKQIGKLRRNPMFDFTKGDKNKFIEVEKTNKKLLTQLLGTIVMGVAVNGATIFIGWIISIVLT